MHRPFPREEALACKASLRWPLDSAPMRSVNPIETAMQCEAVAKNTQCQVPIDLSACRIGSRIHEGMCWGAAAMKRTARQPRKQRP